MEAQGKNILVCGKIIRKKHVELITATTAGGEKSARFECCRDVRSFIGSMK